MAAVNDPGEIARALAAARTIAVVGCSPRPARPSHTIARYLLAAGYDVTPVNPAHGELLERPCFPSLLAVPGPIDIVSVFRRSQAVSELADVALERGGIGFFWMQDGVVDEAAARRLNAGGIGVAMDRCIYRDRETLRRGYPLE